VSKTSFFLSDYYLIWQIFVVIFVAHLEKYLLHKPSLFQLQLSIFINTFFAIQFCHEKNKNCFENKVLWSINHKISSGIQGFQLSFAWWAWFWWKQSHFVVYFVLKIRSLTKKTGENYLTSASVCATRSLNPICFRRAQA